MAARLVASVDWNALRSVYEGRRTRPLFAEIRSRPQIEKGAPASSKSTAADSEFRLQLRNASPARRRSLLITLLRTQISSILGFDLSREIESEQGLFDTGMDSLMSVELKGRLERSLGVPLPSTLTFNCPNIKALADYLLTDALGVNPAPWEETTEPESTSASAKAVSTAVPSEDLTEEELSELLMRKLEEME